MNKNILYAFMAGATAFGLAGCNENSWNNHFLDGFEEGVDYTDSPKGSYTLTADDYSAIAKLLQKQASTDAEKAAAKAIGDNAYFNKTSVYPASVAVLPFLNTSSFPYYLGDDGTTVDIMFNEATDVPEELARLADVKTYTISEADYKKAWGSESAFIKSFAPAAQASSWIASLLPTTFGETPVEEGTYAVVSYNNATQNPMYKFPDVPLPSAKLLTGAFKAGQYVMVDKAASRIAGNLEATKTYGYLPSVDVTIAGNTINDIDTKSQVWNFIATDVAGEYYITDALDRYYYQSGNFNSFNTSATLQAGNDGYIWIVTSEADNTWKITNKAVNKWVQTPYGTYSTWGSYPTAGGDYPQLFAVEADTPEPPAEVLYTPTSVAENAVYYYNGSAWEVATGVVIPNPADYTAMGTAVIDQPTVYLPIYLKSKLPYAQSGDQQFVVYKSDSNQYSAGLFIYNGSEWALNNVNREEVVGRFEKKNGEWRFVKYIGKAIFDLFEEQEIMLERSYIIVTDGFCALPIKKGSTFGYPEVTKVSSSGTQIVAPSDANAFLFTATYESNGKVINAPEGKFLMLDSNGRYLFMGGSTRQNINVSNAPVINDDVIDETYLWTATPNGDGSWSVTNHSDDLVRTWMYSPDHTSYGVYREFTSGRVYPSLYILAE